MLISNKYLQIMHVCCRLVIENEMKSKGTYKLCGLWVACHV